MTREGERKVRQKEMIRIRLVISIRESLEGGGGAQYGDQRRDWREVDQRKDLMGGELVSEPPL